MGRSCARGFWPLGMAGGSRDGPGLHFALTLAALAPLLTHPHVRAPAAVPLILAQCGRPAIRRCKPRTVWEKLRVLAPSNEIRPPALFNLHPLYFLARLASRPARLSPLSVACISSAQHCLRQRAPSGEYRPILSHEREGLACKVKLSELNGT
jgi:hypothetical protein